MKGYLMKQVKQFLIKYKHAWVLLYAFIYGPWFAYLEKTVLHPTYIIHTRLDDLIPFNEYFIIPYYFWFFFVAIAVMYFLFKNTKDFYRLTIHLCIGMTAFLVISSLYPNGQMLRPTEFVRDTIFTRLVQLLYTVDTPANIFPSIHVYNTLCVMIAVMKSKDLQNKKLVKVVTNIIGLLIVLSTMFLKQHSVLDVVGGFVLCGIAYFFIYVVDYKSVGSKQKDPLDNL